MKSKRYRCSGIGSLPYTNPANAVEHVMKYDIPYLPQLPSANPQEGMIYQTLDGIGKLKILKSGEVELLELYAHSKQQTGISGKTHQALSRFIHQTKERHSPIIKVQLTGPFTLYKFLKYHTKDQLLFSQITTFLQKKIAAFHQLLPCPTLLIQIDEPALFALQPASPEQQWFDQSMRDILALKRDDLKIGLHCCSNTDWQYILDLPIDLLSFDYHLAKESLYKHLPALLSLPYIFVGILPTSGKQIIGEIDIEQLTAQFNQEIEEQSIVSLEAVEKSIVFTPACGLATKSANEVQKYLELLKRG